MVLHTLPGVTAPGKGSKNGNGAENAATAVDAVDWCGVLLLLNGLEGTDTLD